LNLYIGVLTNTHPDFTSDVETAFTMAVGDTYVYKLPPTSDPENNDKSIVYVDYMEAQQDAYPPFLLFENATNTITFRPIDMYTSGQTYFFAIVIKEENSDSVIYSYYCTIKMLGDILVRDDTIYWVDVNYTIIEINDKSQGALRFSEPVNMTYLQIHWYDMFKVYWQDINFKTNKEQKSLLDFVVDDFGSEDSMTVNFTMTFEKPYMLGLLLKRSDKVFIDRKESFNISS